MYVSHPVGRDQAARITLDEKAMCEGREDARMCFPDVIEGSTLEDYAHTVVDDAFSNDDEQEDDDPVLTDDREEYRARYVAAYVAAYTEEVQQRCQNG